MGLIDTRKSVIATYFEEVITNGRYELATDIFADNFVWPQFDLHGPQGAVTWAKGFRNAFPDVEDRVEKQVGEDNTIVTLLHITGTHTGPYLGVEPTGRTATWRAVGVDTFNGNKVITRSAHFDVTALMYQLGVTELPITKATTMPDHR